MDCSILEYLDKFIVIDAQAALVGLGLVTPLNTWYIEYLTALLEIL